MKQKSLLVLPKPVTTKAKKPTRQVVLKAIAHKLDEIKDNYTQPSVQQQCLPLFR
jgi:hypothetical protein